MKVPVRLFALAKQRAGASQVEVELPEGATVADLKRRLAETHPALGELLPRMLVAVNEEYADDARTLAPGCELALILPVSGGVDIGAGRGAPS